jgi:hypothetical protein
MPKIRLELTTKAASMLCSTNWASQAYKDKDKFSFYLKYLSFFWIIDP